MHKTIDIIGDKKPANNRQEIFFYDPDLLILTYILNTKIKIEHKTFTYVHICYTKTSNNRI